MAERKTDNLLVRGVRQNLVLPSIRKDKPVSKSVTPGSPEHAVYLDAGTVPGARIYSECIWYRPNKDAAGVVGGEIGLAEHTHPFEEVLAFFGQDIQNPRDLGAQIELILDGQKHLIDKTSLVFIPAGMPHKVAFTRLDKPVFHFSIGASEEFKAAPASAKKGAGSTSQYIVSRMTPPKEEAPWSPPPPPEADGGQGGRILFLDKDIVPGGFYTECVWIAPRPPAAASPEQPGKTKATVQPHKHNFAEVLCFFGTDPQDFTDLDAEIELWVNDEKHIINKSVMVYLPPGTVHCPLSFHRVSKPIIHFTCFPEGKLYYDEVAKAQNKK
jgi:quercetin dioxygenase-like cupin family protein